MTSGTAASSGMTSSTTATSGMISGTSGMTTSSTSGMPTSGTSGMTSMPLSPKHSSTGYWTSCNSAPSCTAAEPAPRGSLTRSRC